MQEVNRPWLFERLKHSLQLLACPPEIQVRKFPDFVSAPDELVLDFANFQMAVVGNFRAELTGEQLSCLNSIDQGFSQMAKDCLSANAVANSPEWRQIRRLAPEALKAFGWPVDDPPKHDYEFVPK
jgi:hypothetical protein